MVNILFAQQGQSLQPMFSVNDVTVYSYPFFVTNMALQPVDQILQALRMRPLSPAQQQFQEVLDCWSEVVGDRIAAQARPLSLERGTLSVATSGAAWSQELTFQTPQILQKLNHRLSMPLQKIRFSVAQWQSPRPFPEVPEVPLWHPSQVGEIEPKKGKGSQVRPLDPQTAFEEWKGIVKVRSEFWPVCPQCGVPAPAGELERWSVCALCATQEI